jgi:dihydroorotase
MQSITITQPDDWHLHLREGAALKDVVKFTAAQFRRAVVMPNLKPPVTTVQQALTYHAEIKNALKNPQDFEPLMALYLTETTQKEEIERAAKHPVIHGFKLYPAGATTHSEAGIGSLQNIYPLLETMEQHDVPLMIHGEATNPHIDIFDRELAFIENSLIAIAERFPGLRIVLEHITTHHAVEYIRQASERIAATITAHHLRYNRNAMFQGGLRPHFYCLPVLKREEHRLALLSAATEGEKKFFLGTDSAPHPQQHKENACACAGCFTAHAAIELYATAFESIGKLGMLEQFASFNGPDFYRLPRNTQQITLLKSEWAVPADYAFGDSTVIPLEAGQTLTWRLENGKSPA